MIRRVGTLIGVFSLGFFALCSEASASSPRQSGSGEQASASASAPAVIGHGSIPVEITKSLDSSKLAQGESIEARTSGDFVLPGGTRVPRGSKVTAHVAEAKARSKGDSQSDLTIVFDKIMLPNQTEQPVKGSIQAVAPKPDDGSGPVDPMVSKQAGTQTGGPPSTTSGSNTQPLGTGAVEILNPQSSGVKGIHNLELSSEGVLTSKGKSVKLDSGDRMIVHIDLLKP